MVAAISMPRPAVVAAWLVLAAALAVGGDDVQHGVRVEVGTADEMLRALRRTDVDVVTVVAGQVKLGRSSWYRIQSPVVLERDVTIEGMAGNEPVRGGAVRTAGRQLPSTECGAYETWNP